MDTAGFIRWILTMTDADLEEMTRKGKGDMAAKVRRAQERGRGAIEAERLVTTPRSESEVLWQVFNGPALAEKFAAQDVHGALAIILGDSGLS